MAPETGRWPGRAIAAGNLVLKLGCMGNGTLGIILRGMDVRDAAGARVPVWIDCLQLSVDGREQLSGPLCICHDRPFRVSVDVADGDVVELRVAWVPHDPEAMPISLEDRIGTDAGLKAAFCESEERAFALAEENALLRSQLEEAMRSGSGKRGFSRPGGLRKARGGKDGR